MVEADTRPEIAIRTGARAAARAVRRGLRAVRGARAEWATEYRAWARKWLAGHGRGIDEAQDLVYLSMVIHHLARPATGMTAEQLRCGETLRIAYAATKSAIGLALGEPGLAMAWGRTAAAMESKARGTKNREVSLQAKDFLEEIAAATVLTNAEQ